MVLCDAFLIAAGPAFAWGRQGHMATGLVAYDMLAQRDPASIAQIVALIAQHPNYARFGSALEGLEGAERERRLFAPVARWPDDIRATPYNHTPWQLRVVVGSTAFIGLRMGKADLAADRPGDDFAGAESIAATEEAALPEVAAPSGDTLSDYRNWARESERIAVESVNPGAIEAEGAKRAKAGILPPDYLVLARSIAEKRIGEAGERLAGLLAALFPKT